VSLINATTEKQETIKRMINRQYEQLLEMCQKSASEIEYMKQNLLKDDPDQQLEIEKTEMLINSIVNDINLKKKEMQSLELKNRYDQLLNLYQQTQDEVQLLEADLKKNEQDTRKSQIKIFAQSQVEKNPNNEDHAIEAPFVVPNQFGRKPNHFGQKRGRLNLGETSMASTKDAVASTEDEEVQYENMMDKWYESLAQIDEIEEEKMLEDFTLPPSPIDVVDEIDMMLFDLPDVPELPIEPVLTQEQEEVETNLQPQTKKKALKTSHKAISGINVFLNITFYLVLITSIFFAFVFGMDNHNHNANGMPRMFLGHSVMRVATGSMTPGLPINTVIVTRHVEPSELRVGNVVTFRTNEERTITHRIYHIYENYQNHGDYGFRLIGDANGGVADDVVHPAEDLIGRVIYYSYPLGRALMFIHRYFLTIMSILVFSFVVLLVAKIRIKTKKHLKNG